jgi:putative DNA primase/helicase
VGLPYSSEGGARVLRSRRSLSRLVDSLCGLNRQERPLRAETPIQPDTTLSAPAQKRLVLTDATFEKLHEILSDNPAGVLVIRDELTGWLAELDRQGREGQRGFFLQAWNGDAGYTIDRIGRGSIHVDAVCVSLLGNIQPSRLRWYLSQVVDGGPSDDGLFQRFQILVWPDASPDWRLVDRPPNATALATAEKVYSRLANLSADDPIRMRFAHDAQRLFYQWWPELESKIRQQSGLAPSLVAHLAKYRGLMPTLAGLFELADLAAGESILPGEVSISLDHTRQAAAFCDFLETHARRVYACVISPECRAAHELARHIRGKGLTSFTTRDVCLKGWGGLDSSERVRGALAMLEDAAWVRRAELPTSLKGGRPTEAWLVNPKVVHREK